MKPKLLSSRDYLKHFEFSFTARYVVKPTNTTHVLMAYTGGNWYVCVEDLGGTVWAVRRDDTVQGFGQDRSKAEAYAAGLHRAETKVAMLKHSVTPEASHG